MSTITESRLLAWIDHLFDHPTAEDINDAWYWAEEAPAWDGPAEEIPLLIAEMGERSGELLARFPDVELDQGFWFLIGSTAPPHFIETLLDSRVPVPDRVRAIRSFPPLFGQVMAVRCSPHLSHLEDSANPLNSSCYMWWDLIWYHLFQDFDKLTPAIAAEIVSALRRQLAIPHDACRESALHGIGHWVKTIPQVAGLVDEFLAANPGLRPELVGYAQKARTGQVI